MLLCAWCHADLAAPVPCPGCSTALHRECWTLAATCPTLGCRERVVVERPRPVATEPPSRWPWPKVALAFLAASCLGVCFLFMRGGLLWDAVTHGSEAEELAFTRDGRKLVALCGAGLRVADARTGEWVQYCELGSGEGLAVSPDGELIATGQQLWRLDQVYGSPRTPSALLPGKALAFSPDGATLACLGEEGRVHLSSLEGRIIRTLDPGPPAKEVGWLWYHYPTRASPPTALVWRPGRPGARGYGTPARE